MPLQLERRGQSVHAFIQELHHAIVAAVNVDLANPDRMRRFNSHRGVGRSNPGAAAPIENLPASAQEAAPDRGPTDRDNLRQ